LAPKVAARTQAQVGIAGPVVINRGDTQIRSKKAVYKIRANAEEEENPVFPI
jgi:hypothetical protein